MNIPIPRVVAAMLCFAALVMTTAGFRSCSAADKQSVAQNVTSGLTVAARSVEPGIQTVRAFREAGKIEPATSLALARAALDTNSAAKAFTQAALDGADATSLAAQLDTVVRLAGELEQSGTLHLKNGDTKLFFELGVVAAKNGLVIAQGEFAGTGGAPVTFTLDDGTRRRLADLLPVFERNDRLLREAIARLVTP